MRRRLLGRTKSLGFLCVSFGTAVALIVYGGHRPTK
jgi:hypothetical protein